MSYPCENMLAQLKTGLIASLRPSKQSAMNSPVMLAAMAEAAIAGGAAAVRIEGMANLIAVREKIDAPIIVSTAASLEKNAANLPALDTVLDFINAGADIIAIDAFFEVESEFEQLITEIHSRKCWVMVECATHQQGIRSQALGADIISTYLASLEAKSNLEPELALVSALKKSGCFVVADGCYRTPFLAKRAIWAGADAVCVGSAISKIERICQWFSEAIKQGVNEQVFGQNSNTCLAVDLGCTKLAVALIKNGMILEKYQTNTLSTSDPDNLTHLLYQFLKPFSYRADRVAVASTGIIYDGSLTAVNPEHLGGLHCFPIQSVIANITSLPTKVINDAQAAAVAEFYAYQGQYKNMAFISVAATIAAGIVLKGKLVTGDHGRCGQIGHIQVELKGAHCGCGRIGCVETIASGKAMGMAALPFFGEMLTGKEVYEHYLNQHPDATSIVLRSAKALSQLIANLTITLDLDAVIIGGSVGLAQNYLGLLEAELEQLPLIFKAKLLPALEGKEASLLGAALWADGKLKLN